MEKLILIQSELNAPKTLYNKFGNYNYRSAESILEAVKPLLQANNCCLTLSDELVNIGERYYIKATATFVHGDFVKEVTAFAREEEIKKGMDGSQITGASSSYARKYALNGLFLIDDVKDSDGTNAHDKELKNEDEGANVAGLIKIVNACKDRASLSKLWNDNKDLHQNADFANAVTQKVKEYPKEK
jgi:hypothetical protein